MISVAALVMWLPVFPAAAVEVAAERSDPIDGAADGIGTLVDEFR